MSKYDCHQKRVKDEAAEGGFQESGDVLKQRHGKIIFPRDTVFIITFETFTEDMKGPHQGPSGPVLKGLIQKLDIGRP